MGQPKPTFEYMQEQGLVAPDHTISEEDQQLLNTLSTEEVNTLATIRTKLGDDLLKKIHQDGRFPPTKSSGF